MSVTVNGIKTFVAGEALAAFRRVKLSAGTVVYADQADSDGFIGWTYEATASGGHAGVILKTRGRTIKAVASEALAAGATCYAAADGKVADTESGNAVCVALDAATADGSVIEVLPL